MQGRNQRRHLKINFVKHSCLLTTWRIISSIMWRSLIVCLVFWTSICGRLPPRLPVPCKGISGSSICTNPSCFSSEIKFSKLLSVTCSDLQIVHNWRHQFRSEWQHDLHVLLHFHSCHSMFSSFSPFWIL